MDEAHFTGNRLNSLKGTAQLKTFSQWTSAHEALYGADPLYGADLLYGGPIPCTDSGDML